MDGIALGLTRSPVVSWALVYADTEFGVLRGSTCCQDRRCFFHKLGLTLSPDVTSDNKPIGWRAIPEDRLDALKEICESERAPIDMNLMRNSVVSVLPIGDSDTQVMGIGLVAGTIARMSILMSQRAMMGIGNFVVFCEIRVNLSEMFGGFGETLEDMFGSGPQILVGFASSKAYIDYLEDEFSDEIQGAFQVRQALDASKAPQDKDEED